MMKIGVLGGSFDPVHNGHLVLAAQALKQLHLDQVLFIPANVPPHKQDSKLTPAVHRVQMLKLALRTEPHFVISDIELQRQGVSYTVDTLEALGREFPGSQFFLLMGSDSYESFASWRNPEKIRSLACIAAAPRQGAPSLLKGDILLEMKKVPVSSTEVRLALMNRSASVAGLVHKDVLSYIEANQLYHS